MTTFVILSVFQMMLTSYLIYKNVAYKMTLNKINVISSELNKELSVYSSNYNAMVKALENQEKELKELRKKNV